MGPNITKKIKHNKLFKLLSIRIQIHNIITKSDILQFFYCLMKRFFKKKKIQHINALTFTQNSQQKRKDRMMRKTVLLMFM